MGRVAALLLTLSLMALAASCRKSGAADEHTIRLAYLPISHALPVVETAADPELRVELIRYGSWPELMDALITGRVDGASVLIELAMKARERGAPLTAVALGHRRGNVIVAGAGVASAEALRGRVFAIPHRNSSHYLLFRSLLEQHGLQPSEVQVVELSPSEMPSALFTGQIGGYCVAEPFGAVGIAKSGGHIIGESDALWPDGLCCALVLNNRMIEQRPSLAARLVKAYHAAGDRLSDPTVALRALKQISRQPDDVLRASLRWIDFSQLTITETAYRDLTERMRRYGLSEAPPEYADFVNPLVDQQ